MPTEIKLLNDEALRTLFKNTDPNSTVIIDIREPSEYAREHIPGSLNIPSTELNKKDFSGDKDKIAVFHCKLGNRTRSFQTALSNTGFKEIYCMEGGIEQWKKCGLPIEINQDAPMDIMRQVQIIAGGLVLLGVVLAYLISFSFILLSAFVGLGLLMAGVTGFCGMAKLLMFLPWNKQNNLSNCKIK